MIFMMRRFFLVLIVTVLRNSMVAQISVMLIYSTVQVGFLSTFDPNEDKLGQKLDIFNEVTTVVLVDFIIVFSEANLQRFDLPADFIFLTCLFGNLCVHLFFLIKSSVTGVKESCRKRKRQGMGVCGCCGRQRVKTTAKDEQPVGIEILVGQENNLEKADSVLMMSVIEEDEDGENA